MTNLIKTNLTAPSPVRRMGEGGDEGTVVVKHPPHPHPLPPTTRARELTWNGLFITFMIVGTRSWSDPSLPVANTSAATITSDEMEVMNHGASTNFTGHVVLTQNPYRVVARRMVQTRATGIVEVYGAVRGTWHSLKEEHVEATGERARYTPTTRTLELWENPKLTRWENLRDPTPTIVTADRFLADEPAKTVWARGNVHITQGTRVDVQAAQARYRTTEETLDLTGGGRVLFHVNDGRGQGDFSSNKAWLSLSPRHARLMDQVQGHVIPVAR